MKITKARLKQIIKEEMDNLDLDEVRISPEDDAAIEAHSGKTCKEAQPEEEYSATGREKKSASAVASGGKLGQEEFKNMLMNLLKSKKVMPADRKAVLSDMFGSVGAKIHQALLAEK